jgi:DNA-binding MarR family transcriptional regulator
MSAEPAHSVTTPLDAEQDEFIDVWEGFLRAIARARGRTARCDDSGLTPAQYALLEPLADTRKALPVGWLADSAGVSGPTATRMLGALEATGHVERAGSSRDRRVVLVSLTDAGRVAFERRRLSVSERRRRIAAGLTREERRQASVLLARLTELVDEQP